MEAIGGSDYLNISSGSIEPISRFLQQCGETSIRYSGYAEGEDSKTVHCLVCSVGVYSIPKVMEGDEEDNREIIRYHGYNIIKLSHNSKSNKVMVFGESSETGQHELIFSFIFPSPTESLQFSVAISNVVGPSLVVVENSPDTCNSDSSTSPITESTLVVSPTYTIQDDIQPPPVELPVLKRDPHDMFVFCRPVAPLPSTVWCNKLVLAP